MTILLIGLALKMVMTAVIVVVASVVVERSGPFIGALIAALPTAAGAVYIILAIEHPPPFIAASAVGTVAANAAVALFALSYTALAQRRSLPVSLSGTFLVWFAYAALLRLVEWTPLTAVVLNAVAFTLTIAASSLFRTDCGGPTRPGSALVFYGTRCCGACAIGKREINSTALLPAP